jgi:DNA-binding transcriptional LysR family regulator
MDLAGMEIFARVVEAKSFSAAARRLHLSKSVVSKHVTRLERSMGVRLLNRTTRCVSLTEIGREFYERCAEILAAAEQAELSATRLQSEPRGTLRISAPVTFGHHRLAPLLPDLLATCPALSVDLTLTNREIHVVEEGFDVALVIAHDLPPGMVARRITDLPRVICAAPAYVAERGMPQHVDDLRRHECLVCTGNGQDARWRLRGPDGEVAVPVRGRFAADALAALHVAALRGVGIALLPAFLADGDLRDGTLVPVLPTFVPVAGTLHALYPPTRHVSPKVRAFVDFLVARFGASAAGNAPLRSTGDRVAGPPPPT